MTLSTDERGRITARVPQNVWDTLQQAAELLGTSSHSSDLAARRSGMAGNQGAGLIGDLAVWHCTRSRQFHFSATRGSYVFFAELESVPEDESQHGLRCVRRASRASFSRRRCCALVSAGWGMRGTPPVTSI